jgi:hypothetical protein
LAADKNGIGTKPFTSILAKLDHFEQGEKLWTTTKHPNLQTWE